jgi:nucleotide-binding universal stress UspA family protein
MKILLATDGSDYSKAAVKAVAERQWPEGSKVKIISAVEIPYTPMTEVWMLPDSYYNDLENAARAQAEAAIEDAAEEIRSGKTAWLEIADDIKRGSARNVILDEAEKWDADLIVLGSHGYGGLQRFLLGSVSHAVATHAHCSVEIVRRKEAGKEKVKGWV